MAMSAWQNTKDTLYLRAFTMLKIPLIAYMRPSIVEMDDRRCVVRIPLSRRTRNHLQTMYFGALCAGADVAGGIIAMRRIQQAGSRVHFLFKDFHAEFLKRAEGDVYFTCEQGEMLTELVHRAEASGDREEAAVDVVATVPDRLGDEPVARFQLTISLKRRD
jgi:acyl-coenzyme A thioesterase PaaI-like protein